MFKKVGYEKEILKDPLVSNGLGISCTATAVVGDCLRNKAGGSLVAVQQFVPTGMFFQSPAGAHVN